MPIQQVFTLVGDYASPLLSVEYVFGTGRPKPLAPIRNVVYPLDKATWVATSVAIVVVSIVFTVFIALSNWKNSDHQVIYLLVLNLDKLMSK